MVFTRWIARPLLATIFVVGGLDAFRNPAGKAKRAGAVTEPLHTNVPATAEVDTETMVRINGGVQVVAGLFLAVGKFRRLASYVLMGSLVPTTYAGHRFWEETDDSARTQQTMHFAKNLGLLGGLLLAAVDTEGEPSLAWRARRRARDRAAARRDRHGNDRPRRHRVKETGLDVAQKAAGVRRGVQAAHNVVTDSVLTRGAGPAQQAAEVVSSAAGHLKPLVESASHKGAARAGDTLAKLADRASTA